MRRATHPAPAARHLTTGGFRAQLCEFQRRRTLAGLVRSRGHQGGEWGCGGAVRTNTQHVWAGHRCQQPGRACRWLRGCSPPCCLPTWMCCACCVRCTPPQSTFTGNSAAEGGALVVFSSRLDVRLVRPGVAGRAAATHGRTCGACDGGPRTAQVHARAVNGRAVMLHTAVGPTTQPDRNNHCGAAARPNHTTPAARPRQPQTMFERNSATSAGGAVASQTGTISFHTVRCLMASCVRRPPLCDGRRMRQAHLRVCGRT
jgi:predicted outer membrane repeat protein